MEKMIGFALLLVGSATFAAAGTTPVPEIDATAAGSAIALAAGALVIYRGRCK